MVRCLVPIFTGKTSPKAGIMVPHTEGWIGMAQKKLGAISENSWNKGELGKFKRKIVVEMLAKSFCILVSSRLEMVYRFLAMYGEKK